MWYKRVLILVAILATVVWAAAALAPQACQCTPECKCNPCTCGLEKCVCTDGSACDCGPACECAKCICPTGTCGGAPETSCPCGATGQCI